ncbi:MAG: uracil-DNA glycosylase [bacterium]|nr:uracil-DNA glycosylase [bacterium]
MDKKEKLEEIAREVKKCQRCRLFKTATNAVPGAGNQDTKIMFIGEGPGYHEDQQGLPFVGQAGKLLDQLLESIKLKREEVFIGNVVKHRPPENRDPFPDEIEACSVWLDQQIEVIDPSAIVTLGRFSMNKFLPGEFISRAHGQPRFVEDSDKKRIVMPMYHPAAALRNSLVMETLKNDFQKIPGLLGEKKEVEEKKKKDDNGEQLELI